MTEYSVPCGKRKTVHFVYPHRNRISAPHAIGRKVAERLAARYEIRQYELDSMERIRPASGDVLLGHPHPVPGTVFRRSLHNSRWSRILAMYPFNGSIVDLAFLNPIVKRSHKFLAITGSYWFGGVANSVFSHWLPKMVHLDLAVDRTEFPPIKTAWNPIGRRRFLYIGNLAPQKNVGYLSRIAQAAPDLELSWIGGGKGAIDGVRTLGYHDFRSGSALGLVSNFDFLVTVGGWDANPTTILEAMAWGLVPICTPQSGYAGNQGVINVPLDDVAQAVDILRQCNVQKEERLFEYQSLNWRQLDTHFNWDRFAGQLVDEIESSDTPVCLPQNRASARMMARSAWTGTGAWWRRRHFLPLVKANLGREVRHLAKSIRMARGVIRRGGWRG